VTVPVPVPVRVTVTAIGRRSNAAVTLVAAPMVKVQVPKPVHAPLQPAKVELTAGVAVRVTTVPKSRSVAQLAPQLMPPTLEVMVPAPPPDCPTESVKL
jgi:hypothetical protein